MDNKIILLPLFAQVALTAIVWFYMYYTRLKEIFVNKIAVEDLKHKPTAAELLKNVAGPSDNLVNLFEMPVLFYVAIMILYVGNMTNYLFVLLASFYVFLRFLHSMIHISYNQIQHRFVVYFLSSMVLWTLWLVIAIQIIGSIRW